MDYKSRILWMIERIHNEKVLKKIDSFVTLWYSKC